MMNGNLYRPTQDSRVTYGHRILIQKITSLSETSFEEEMVHVLNPVDGSRYAKGIHTLNLTAKWAVIDGKKFIFKGRKLF
jgi:hypothetical protein